MQNIRIKLNQLLESAFDSLPVPLEPSSLYNPVRYINELGGKRLRPRLVLLSAGLCGGKPENALQPALAVEMLHNFTLVHDDIMDNAVTRRGKTTIHRKWDEATAILSGDVLFVLAMKQLAIRDTETGSDSGTLEMLRVFLDAVQTVCDGQAMDMDFETRDDVTPDEYLEMIRAKTAALLRCSMELGAISANADEAARQRCRKIGESAGLAFQIQDDLLDAVGDASLTGKRIGGDILAGKKTWLSITARERADDADHVLLNNMLGNAQAGESGILRIIRIYHDLGVIDDAVRAVSAHYNKALQLLDGFKESGYQSEIKTLLDKLKIRET